MEKLLVIENLSVEFPSPRGPLRAVDGVSLEVNAGEIVGLIGESGSGKSTVLLAVMGLISRPGRILPGSSVRLKGRELTQLSPAAYRAVRGYEIGMVFQDPMTALNPAMPIGEQVRESLRVHRYCKSRAEERERVIRLLEAVGITNAAQRYRAYPHQFSGGMLSTRADRLRPGLQSPAAAGGRAHHGPGRHDPGADPGPAEGRSTGSGTPPSCW